MKQVTVRQNIEDELRCIEYILISGKGVKYQNAKTCIYDTGILLSNEITYNNITLTKFGILYVHAGYQWNGPNIIPDSDSSMRGSLIHDALCELLAMGLLQKHHVKRMNDIFYDVCKADGMSEWLNKLHRLGLKTAWQGGARL